jgi:hypothetical protein
LWQLNILKRFLFQKIGRSKISFPLIIIILDKFKVSAVTFLKL